jgi:flagellar hook-basal body complex protein FliE
MDIQRIGTSLPLPAVGSAAGAATGAATGDFGRMIGDVLQSLSATEQSTGNLIARAATGNDVDIHDVMIATQAESLAFQVGVQVRNKLVEAYQEVFRMQM